MVDDASSDNTLDLIKKLASQHQEIKYFVHKNNKGGGAARNTAVKHSSGDMIFCLDSDDILGPEMLNKMTKYLLDKKCDGVGISKSIKFKANNTSNIDYVTDFIKVDQKVAFEDLFNSNSCSLYSTFLFTMQAFEVTGGYPEDHGFDTQGFAFRFLANGLTAYTCPEAIYYHRTQSGRSYYIREFEAGKANHNWLKIYEEFLYLYSNELKEEILKYDLNNFELPLNNFVNNYKNKYSENYKKLLTKNTKENYKNNINKNSKYDYYWLANESYMSNDLSAASEYFVKAINMGLDSKIAYYKLFDSLARKNNLELKNILTETENFYSYQKQGSARPISKKIFHKIKRLMKK